MECLPPRGPINTGGKIGSFFLFGNNVVHFSLFMPVEKPAFSKSLSAHNLTMMGPWTPVKLVE
jgi:hypothetical protein